MNKHTLTPFLKFVQKILTKLINYYKYLKINILPVKSIHTHANSRLIVEGIVHMAKLFNYDVIAEFVHNKEVLDVLNEIGVEYSQGYYFSPPVEMPELK